MREPNGLLRDALPSERGRMNRLYFARPHCDVELPKLFFQPYVQRLFDQRQYVHVLDYACYLLEPNDPTYVRVSVCNIAFIAFSQICTETFTAVEQSRAFDDLWSSRHWAQALFFYALNHRLDAVALYYAEHGRMAELALFARLYEHIHNDKSDSAKKTDNDVLQAFVLSACASNARLRQLVDAFVTGRTSRDSKSEIAV